jgi:7-cyano-7-deazaguanine synthase
MTDIKDQRQSAVVLLSGGIDSYTTAAEARAQGYRLYAISFDYAQRHRRELQHAARIAKEIGVEKHLVVKLNLRDIGGSALTDDIDVPKGAVAGQIGNEIPVTYVPARNTIFLSVALAWAEKLGAGRIFIGANAVDYSGYPDCRPEFIAAFERMANLATKAGVEGNGIRIEAPLINLSKAQIIARGLKLGLDYSLSLSCYDPDDDDRACGQCESCLLRHRGFVEAGVDDPTAYRQPPRE